jgi:DNA-binding winged helix-turn-helix (wHTH) protein/TolB-like protein
MADIVGDSIAERFRIADWEVDPSACRLTRNGVAVKVSPRSMEVLVYLARRSGETVSNDELLTAFWRGAISSPNAVHKVVTELRHALGDGDEGPVYIETVPKRGYRLVAPVARVEYGNGSVTTAAIERPGSTPTSLPAVATAARTSGDRSATRPKPISVNHRAVVWAMLVAVIGIGTASAFIWGTKMTRDSATASSRPIRSLAVLRFRNIDGNADNDYLADGIATALLNQLTKAANIKVVDKERAFQHSLTHETVGSIANALDAEYVLDGTTQRTQDRIRASVTLYLAKDGSVIYSYSHDEPLDRLFVLQDKVVGDVLTELEVPLDEKSLTDMRDWGTKSVAAYLAAEEADHFLHLDEQQSLPYAAARFRDAIALDPGFVQAYCGLSDTLGLLAYGTADSATRDAVRREIQGLRETVERIDPANVLALNHIRWEETRVGEGGSWASMEAQLRANIQAAGAPTKPIDDYLEYADILMSGHLFREAASFVDAYARFDPDNPWIDVRRNQLTCLTRGWGSEPCVESYRRLVRRMPDSSNTVLALVNAFSLSGQYDLADRYLTRLREVDPHGIYSRGAWLFLSVQRGDLARGSPAFRAAVEDPATDRFSAGVAYFMVDDIDSGLAAWRSAPSDIREFIYRLTVHSEGYYKASVVRDPRFQAYLDERGIGRQWTAFLREKVAEMAPITGIAPTDPSPQFTVSR